MSPQTDLSRFKVLVTRPQAQQQALNQELQRAGAAAVPLPLLKIVALQTSPGLRQKIQQLDKYDTLIFVSSNAASLGAQLINEYWPQFPVGVTVAAIGPGTAGTLEQCLQCNVVYPDAGFTTEDLLQLTEFSQLENKKVALFRGAGGRELLSTSLQERGAIVDYLELYQRQLVNYRAGHLQQIMAEQGVNSIAISSGEALSRLCQIAGINKPELVLIPLLVPSERVRQQALAEGFGLVINCKGADPQSVLSGLHELARK